MKSLQQQELERQALRRGVVLTQVECQRPAPILETSLKMQLDAKFNEPEFAFSKEDLRKIIDYLAGHDLIEYEVDGDLWATKITSKGVDYLAGIGNTLDGVNRG